MKEGESAKPDLMTRGGAVFINPGSEDTEGGTEEQATENIKQFIADCSIKDLKFVRAKEEDDYGRFAFIVYKVLGDLKSFLIHMPGWELAKVRYTGEKNQNPFEFPRLYKNHSSWLWKFALIDENDFQEEE